MIELQNISKSYDKVKALENVNLKFQAGEFVSLVGPSGAGKSTLIKLLTREERPDCGKIIIAGRNVVELKDQEIPYYRRKIGVVFQDYKLLPQKTVYENIAFAMEVCEALTADIKTRVPKILDLVGLDKKAKMYPDKLSGGEKQRVGIARSLVHSPKIIIADEPTGNLDPGNAWEITELLLKINNAGALVIFATHNKNIVDKLHKRVISLKKGRVISDQRIGKYFI